MDEIQVKKGYELYQIITDFGDPLEIFREAFQNAFDEGADEIFCRVYERKKLGGSDLMIDIWNNGEGLSREQEMIPILSQGQYICSGLALDFPVIIQVDELDEPNKPDSKDIKVIDLWKEK